MKGTLQPSFVPSKRKYLFCGDQEGMERLSSVIEKVRKDHLPFESFMVNGKQETDIARWMENQKMGSYLYIAMEWNRLTDVKKIAEECGFSEEEAQYIGHGERFINVYCFKCHQKMKVNSGLIHSCTTCLQCHLVLSISDHYSSLHESYLGYAATTGSDLS
ncbi:hypothetical protein LCL96_17205 [Rossellomorea aquimaris]|uniref:hypothetical protein n=1 Tax=Rossellomorea TaxID=2837508 RepID=UPI001CD730CF|nr:hypothetical protein [Rossellomorea aquimaris]MCA1060677.1 hypothetical protein [Rossellomorea aquimaris]